MHHAHSDVTFSNEVDDDITSAAGTVTCANSSYTTPLLNCSAGCTGAYIIPSDCKICSADSSSGTCSSCPKATYGGTEAAIACRLCPYGFTTVYPPSSTSSADCVPITDSPTQVPTNSPSQRPSSMPTVRIYAQGVDEMNARTKTPNCFSYAHPP